METSFTLVTWPKMPTINQVDNNVLCPMCGTIYDLKYNFGLTPSNIYTNSLADGLCVNGEKVTDSKMVEYLQKIFSVKLMATAQASVAVDGIDLVGICPNCTIHETLRTSQMFIKCNIIPMSPGSKHREFLNRGRFKILDAEEMIDVLGVQDVSMFIESIIMK